MARWTAICDQCWEKVNPDQYFPYHDFSEYAETCGLCGEDTFANVHVNPKDIEEYRKEVAA